MESSPSQGRTLPTRIKDLIESYNNEIGAIWNLIVQERLSPANNLDNIRALNSRLLKDTTTVLDEILFAGLNFEKEVIEGIAAQEKSTLCGKCFAEGEAVYSCLDCQTDPTCVMCVECFEHSKHKCHRQLMQISQGGGYCDCGDPEAWKEDHACSIHQCSEEEQSESTQDPDMAIHKLPPDFVAKLKSLCDNILPYICSTMKKMGLPQISERAQAIICPDTNSYVVCLYNDESHSFDEVISEIMQATKCLSLSATTIANYAHEHGRAIMHCSDDWEYCTAIVDALKDNSGLDARCFQTGLVAEQEVAVAMFAWFQNIAATSAGARRIVATCIHGSKFEECDHQLALINEANIDNWTPIEQILNDYPGLWKDATNIVREGSVTLLFVEPDLKRDLGLKFLKRYKQFHKWKYPALERDAYSNLSCQVFTVRSIAEWLIIDHSGLETLLKMVNWDFTRCSDDWGTLDCNDESYLGDNGCYAHVLNDLRYLLECGVEGGSLSVIGALPEFLNLLSFMEDMDPHTRQTSFHLEYEATAWQKALMLCYCVVAVWPHFIKGCSRNIADLKQAMNLTINKIRNASSSLLLNDLRSIVLDGVSVYDFDVGTKPVSVHAPLERYFAGLITAATQLSDAPLSEYFPALKPNDEIHIVDAGILQFIERPLRTFVMSSQSKANLWVRNGLPIPSIFYHIQRWESLGGFFTDMDIVAIQTGAVMLPVKTFVLTLMRRFGIDTWFTRSSSSKPVILDHTEHMLSEFLTLLIHIFGERWTMGVGVVTKRQIVRRELIHLLFAAPIPFSQFRKHLPKSILEYQTFEDVLEEVSIISQKSDGSGAQFTLKKELSNEFDSYFLHYSATRRQAALARANDVSKNTFIPPPPPPQWRTPFAKCRMILLDKFSLSIIYTVIFHAASAILPESKETPFADVPTHQCLHLLVIGLQDKDLNGDLANEIVSACFEPMGTTLLKVLCELKKNQRWSTTKGEHEFSLEVEWIIDQLRKCKRPVVVDALASVSTDSGDFEAAKARRQLLKAEAKRRQARVMATFAKRQRQFLELHDSKRKRTEPPPVCPAASTASRTVTEETKCLVCLENILSDEPTDDDEGAAVFVYIQRHSAMEHVGGSLCADPLLLTSCGHGMHYGCAEVWKRSRLQSILGDRTGINIERIEHTRDQHGNSRCMFKDFFCPLCNDIANVMIPFLPRDALVLSAEIEVREAKDAELNSLASDLSILGLQRSVQNQDNGFIVENTIFSKSDEIDPITDGFANQLDLSALQTMASFSRLVARQCGRLPTPELSSTQRVQFFHQNLTDLLITTITSTVMVESTEGEARREMLPLGYSRAVRSLGRILKFSSARYPQQFDQKSMEFIKSLISNDTTEQNTIMEANVFVEFVRGLFCMCRENAGMAFVRPWARLCMLLSVIQKLRSTVNGQQESDSTAIGHDQSEIDCLIQVVLPGTSSVNVNYTTVKETCLIEFRKIWLAVQIFEDEKMILNDPHDFNTIRSRLEFPDLQKYIGAGALDALTMQAHNLIRHWLGDSLERRMAGLDTSASFGNHIVDLDRRGFKLKSLIQLPNEFRELIYRATEQTCPNTGKPMSQPALCLTCGAFICTESACCRRSLRSDGRSLGACTIHSQSCGNKRGMFLQIKSCIVIMLDGDRGGYVDAPYVDERGEVDRGLKRGRPLFLQPNMYARLNHIFQSQRLSSDIAKIMRNNYYLALRQWQEL